MKQPTLIDTALERRRIAKGVLFGADPGMDRTLGLPDDRHDRVDHSAGTGGVVSGETLLRNPSRSGGKAHRPSAKAGITGTTACGQWARDMTEVPAAEVDAAERCGRCEKTAAVVPEYLVERYALVGADSHHYTYEEWCAIYPLTRAGKVES